MAEVRVYMKWRGQDWSDVPALVDETIDPPETDHEETVLVQHVRDDVTIQGFRIEIDGMPAVTANFPNGYRGEVVQTMTDPASAFMWQVSSEVVRMDPYSTTDPLIHCPWEGCTFPGYRHTDTELVKHGQWANEDREDETASSDWMAPLPSCHDEVHFPDPTRTDRRCQCGEFRI